MWYTGTADFLTENRLNALQWRRLVSSISLTSKFRFMTQMCIDSNFEFVNRSRRLRLQFWRNKPYTYYPTTTSVFVKMLKKYIVYVYDIRCVKYLIKTHSFFI